MLLTVKLAHLCFFNAYCPYYAYSFQQQMILQTTPHSWRNVLFFFPLFCDAE